MKEEYIKIRKKRKRVEVRQKSPKEGESFPGHMKEKQKKEEGGEINWSNPSKVNQMKKFTPKGPGKRTMKEQVIVGFRIGGTEKTQLRRQNKMGVKTLETILCGAQHQAMIQRMPSTLGSQRKPDGRGMEREGVAGIR